MQDNVSRRSEDYIKDPFAKVGWWLFGGLRLLKGGYTSDEVHLFGLPDLRALEDLPAEVYGEEQRDVDVWKTRCQSPVLRSSATLTYKL